MSELKFYPLTSSQQMMFFSLKYSYKKSIVNICSSVDFKGEIDPKIMLQALSLGMLRNPSNAIRLRMVGKQVMQYFSEQAPDKIDVLDFTGLSDEEQEAYFTQWSETPFPNGQMDTQLYVTKLVKRNDGFYSLYFCVSHCIFDAYSLMSTIQDILTIYKALLENTPLPKDWSSPLPCYEADIAYQQSEKYQKDLDFWDKWFDTEPQYTSPNGLGSKEFDKDPRTGTTRRLWQITARHINLIIPKELAEGVQEYAMANRVSPQSVYLLAVRSFLSKVCDTEDVFFMNTIARRATIAQKKAGGTMVNAIPFRTIIDNNLSFTEGCKIFNRTQSEVYRHGNVTFGDISDTYCKKFKLKSCHGYHTMSITFQPYFNLDGLDVPFSFRRICNGAATMPLYMTIMPTDNSGALNVNYEYIKGFIKEESIEKLHAFLLKFLEAGVKSPDKPLKELMA